MSADLTAASGTENRSASQPFKSQQVSEGDLLWCPSPERAAATNLAAFTGWVEQRTGRSFRTYHDLWEWSVEQTEDFWAAVWDHVGMQSAQPYERVLAPAEMPGARWFPGARLNYTAHVLRNEQPGMPALLFAGEQAGPAPVTWDELAGNVRIAATRLREMGVGPGDRVVAYLPNVPEAVVSMLATAAIGAVWSACSPDFGVAGVVDRLGQLEPAVLIAADGYSYGGRAYDRLAHLREIVQKLPTLRAVIRLRSPSGSDEPLPGALDWEEFLDHPGVRAEDFACVQVPFDHPLWVLFSSGTTGPPKAIVHGHGGIMLEHLKLQRLHMDLSPGDTAFFYTTTGWMMWNFLVSGLLHGVRPVLFDGSPAHPDVDVLWRVVADTRTRLFGASPSYVELMQRHGVVPGERFDLSALDSVMPAGSPVAPWVTNWFYENVKRDLWVATGSGGTDCCTGFVGGVPTLPVYAGEIQAPSLGVAARAFDEHGDSVVDEVGELVITKPMPSMPVMFWGDEDRSRYREAYFDRYPGVWRHGDLLRINQRAGCFVLGRSDATLNRHGVRIGTAEVYRAVESLDEVTSALVVNLDLPGGGFFMPLFVQLRDGIELDDALELRVRSTLREQYTARHEPDRIVAVPAIPVTKTGKKMEVPVRRLLLGEPMHEVAKPEAMAEPTAMDAFATYRDSQHDYRLC